MPLFMSNESDTSLTPYMLIAGPILLMGAFILWPAADYVGTRGTDSLAQEADTLMPLLIAASLGTMVMFGGLYLLNSEMMANADGMNKQLLTVGSMLIIASLVAFIMGMGSNVSVINAENTDIDAVDPVGTYETEADQKDSQQNYFDAGSTAWQMSPVTWGLAMIIIGFVAFSSQRPEGAMGFVLPSLMAVGTAFLAAPILNEPSFFNLMFPVVMIFHIIIGGLLLSGNLAVPGSE